MNLGLRKDHNRSRTYTGIYDLGSAGKNDAPDLSEGSSDYESWVLENTLNYDRAFGKHNISALVGYSAQKDKSYGLNGSNTDIPEFIYTMTGNVKTMTASSSLKELTLVSLFGRVMYTYDDRYLFSASIRRDGSSRFQKDIDSAASLQHPSGGISIVKNSSNRWKIYLTNSNSVSAMVN